MMEVVATDFEFRMVTPRLYDLIGNCRWLQSFYARQGEQTFTVCEADMFEEAIQVKLAGATDSAAKETKCHL
jgi:hypothetical protein